MDPALFYTGLVADLYRPLRSAAPDPDVYARFVALSGEPALELGCGTGDPILELRRRGIEVDGVDASADMLDHCARAAEDLGVTVALYHQRMEELDLPRRYRSIYLAGPTFNLLPTDEVAAMALGRIRAHLADGGSALVPLFVPAATPPERFGQAAEATDGHGRLLRVSVVGERRDEARRTQETVLRYERVAGDSHVTEDRVWTLHWHSQEGFRTLAGGAGLRTAAVLDANGEPADGNATSVAFWLQAAA